MSILHHDGIAFHYEQYGAGPPVVFTHGLSGDLTTIQELLGELPGYSLLLWDARGHGQTEPMGPPEALTFRQFALDLRALLGHLDIEQAVVGGVSMGAGISTRFAIDWPDMVRGLVLIRPAWLDQPSPEPLRSCQLIGQLLEQHDLEEGLRRFLQSPEYEEVRQVDPDTAVSFTEQFTKPQAAERSIRLRVIPQSCPIGNWSEVDRLTMPTLVIACEPDYTHPLSYAAQWCAHLPHADFLQVPSKSIDEAAHREAVRVAVDDFLQAITPPS